PVSFEIVAGPATISNNTITLDGVAGTVVVRATQNGDDQFEAAEAVEQSFAVTAPDLLDQTISFDAIPDKLTTDEPFDIFAEASSGLPVSFEIASGPATIANNTITLSGAAGTVTVRATQNGNTNYNPAPSVEQSFAVTAANTGCTVVSNFALNKPTQQSSVVFGAVSSRAVDGNTNGAFLDGSVIATDNETNPWWEVDLGEVISIETINIWNRTDNRRDRLSNYYVLISEQPFSSNTLDDLLNDASVTALYEADEALEPTVLNLNATGRYVRVQLNYAEHLTIAEVEVLGCSNAIDEEAPEVTLSTASTTVSSAFPVALDFTEPISGLSLSDFSVSNADLSGLQGSNANWSVLVSPIDEGPVSIRLPANTVTDNAGNTNLASNLLSVDYIPNGNETCNSTENLALNKPATQSGEVFGGSPDKAVDGNNNGNFNAGSVTATSNIQNAWWEVDLGEVSNIDMIKLWNRTDNRSDRFSN
ncbi:MAG: discoidin domain-containing protein, partial [Bacteroidota bacterium]